MLLPDRTWDQRVDRLCSWESPRLERGYLHMDVQVRNLRVEPQGKIGSLECGGAPSGHSPSHHS